VVREAASELQFNLNFDFFRSGVHYAGDMGVVIARVFKIPERTFLRVHRPCGEGTDRAALELVTVVEAPIQHLFPPLLINRVRIEQIIV